MSPIKVGGLIPVSSSVHVEVSLGKVLNPELTRYIHHNVIVTLNVRRHHKRHLWNCVREWLDGACLHH